MSFSAAAATVTSITPSVATINDATAAGGTFTLAVTYNEVMNTSVNPTIAFSPSIASTLSFSSGAWSNGATTYTATYGVSKAGVSVSGVDVTVSGAQSADDNPQTPDTQNNVFAIDTVDPTVSGLAPSVATINDATATSGTFTLAVTYDEAMNTSDNPTIAFSPSIASTLSFTSGAWTGGGTVYAASYAVSNAGVIARVDVTVSGAQNPDGNTQTSDTQDNVFAIDTVNPTVTSITPSVATINDAVATGGSFTLAVTYSAVMNTSDNPTIAFSPTIASTLSFSSGAWSGGGTIYTATYAVSNAHVVVSGVDVTVSGAQNADGNTQTSDTQNNVFAIDTVDPTVSAIVPSVTTINDATAASGTFTLAITYNETMNTSVNPTIAFSPSISSTLSFSSGAWSGGGTVYAATYAVSNADVVVAGVNVTVTAAQNTDGNTQTSDTHNDAFAIDTVNPTVTAIAPSVATINDATASGGTFKLAITFSTAMNTSDNPTITFTPTIASTLSFTSGAWSGGSTIYTATYAVSNAHVSVTGVNVTVSGAQNTDGNTQTSDTQNNVFAIDTVNPTVTAIAPSVTTINDATATSGTFTLAVTYSAVMNTSVNPTIAFSPTIASTLSFSSGAWSGGGTVYTATYSVSNADVVVSGVNVTVSGAQNADGNTQTSDTQNNVFAIDTVNPTVTAIAPSATVINDATASGGTFTLAVTYSAVMNTAVNPTIAFSPTIASTLSFSSGAWSGGGTTYTATYAVSNANVIVSGVNVTVSGAQNADGNTQTSDTQNNVFAIDTVNPTVTAIAPSVATINVATATSGTFTLAVTFSAAMNTADNPTIAFSPTIASTLSFSSGAWSGGGTVYTATYTVSNADLVVSGVDVTVSGAQDANGNPQISDTQNNVFAIDTVNPTVTAIAPSVTTINDATATSGTFTLAVTYSAVMNTSVNPTIAFSPTIASTLSFSSGAWSGGGTIYTATYSVTNADVQVSGVNVTVSGAKNADGNTQLSATQNNLFAIDTVNPTVTALAPSVTTINDATATAGTFTLAVTYSTVMNTAVNPTIAFSPTIGSTLSFASGAWSGGGTIYTASYAVSNADLIVAGVKVTVSGAQNADGNTQTSDTQNNVFAIDTVNPTVTAIAPSVATINVATATSGTFTLAVTFSAAMNTADNPTIAFSPTIASTLSFSSGAWSGGGTVYTATYTVSNADLVVSGVDVTVSGAQDANGNPQISDTQNNVFAIDTVNPTVTAIAPSVTTINDATATSGTFTLAVTYSAVMNTSVNPTIAFSPTIASTLSFSSGAWSGGGTIYTATYSVTNADVQVSGVNVTVSGAKNADGNTQLSATQNNLFAIDTVNPTVTALAPSVTTINDATATAGTFTLAVTYSTVMNTAVNPTIAFSPTIGSTLSFASGAWSGGGTIYTASYAVSNADLIVAGVKVTVSGAQNADGNTQTSDTQNNVFAIDTVNPTVTAIAPSVATINVATATSGTFTLAVTFSAAMNTADNPTIAFSPTIASTLSFSSGAWSGGGTVYTATYTVSNADLVVSGVDVTVSGAQDANGNPQISDTQNNVFAIDTVNPTVTAIAPSVTTINDATATSGTFTLAVTYSAVMNTSVNPTIAFSPTIASTLSFSSGAWSGGGTIYTATYSVTNADVQVSGVNVTVSGAKNADGNTQLSATQNNLFAIDTVNPTVTALAPSVTTINDATATAGTFTLAVTYSTVMNTAVNPTIAFSPTIGSTLSFASGAWSGGGTIYTASYAVSNADLIVAGVKVTVSGAQNADGNTQTSDTQNNVFAIDTVNPTVTAIAPSVATINVATATSGTFTLAVTFSAAMNTADNPTIAFSPTIASTLSFSSGAWSGGGTVYTATYTVSNADLVVSGVDVTVSGAQDANGNPQISDTQNNVFAIDTVNPTVTAIAPSVTTINDATATSGTFTLAVTYSAVMNTSVNPTIAFSPTIASTLSFSSGAWTGGGTVYTATYAVSNADVVVSGVNVTVSGAQNADGNTQTSDTQNNVFAIDTVNPTVTAIAPSATVINDATATSGTFTLAVTYNAAMNTAVNPTIAFSPTIASTLSFASGAWSGGGTIYTASYAVSNADLIVAGVKVTVSGAEHGRQYPDR